MVARRRGLTTAMWHLNLFLLIIIVNPIQIIPSLFSVWLHCRLSWTWDEIRDFRISRWEQLCKSREIQGGLPNGWDNRWEIWIWKELFYSQYKYLHRIGVYQLLMNRISLVMSKEQDVCRKESTPDLFTH